MPSTPNENLPYPAPADPCDVPGDLKRLASRTDDVINVLRGQVSAVEGGITERDADARYVNTDVNGDTMAGNLDIDKHWPTVTLDGSANGPGRLIFSRGGSEDATVRGDSSGAFAIIVPGGPTSGSIRVNRADGSVSLTGAAYVSLPPPTANTHAARKQDVDAKVSKSGDTMTGPLKVSDRFGLVHLTNTNDPAGLQHVLYVGNNGQYEHRFFTESGGFDQPAAFQVRPDRTVSFTRPVTMTDIVVAQSQVRFGPSGEWRTGYFSDEYRVQRGGNVVLKINPAGDLITFSAQLAPPVPDAAQRVPRLARTPDETTGDLGLPGFAGSDTGWRDVSADIESGYGWTGGTLLIRRDGNRVEMQGYGLTNGGSGEAQNLYAAPADGFRRRVVSAGDVTHSNATVGVGQASPPTSTSKGDNVASVALAGNGVLVRVPSWMQSFTAQWTTVTGWPTSLPGTEVSPPAKWS